MIDDQKEWRTLVCPMFISDTNNIINGTGALYDFGWMYHSMDDFVNDYIDGYMNQGPSVCNDIAMVVVFQENKGTLKFDYALSPDEFQDLMESYLRA